MAYDLEEQEQLAQLKAWWQKYGNPILSAVTVVLLGFAAYNGWRWYEREQAKTAAGIYGQLEQAIESRDAAKVQTIAASIQEHYGRTTYAARRIAVIGRRSASRSRVRPPRNSPCPPFRAQTRAAICSICFRA